MHHAFIHVIPFIQRIQKVLWGGQHGATHLKPCQLTHVTAEAAWSKTVTIRKRSMAMGAAELTGRTSALGFFVASP